MSAQPNKSNMLRLTLWSGQAASLASPMTAGGASCAGAPAASSRSQSVKPAWRAARLDPVEALLLESNLIKKLRPRFNVTLRDDKSFPYILITADHWAPQILKHRGGRSRDGNYYGPFASVWAVNRTITALQRDGVRHERGAAQRGERHAVGACGARLTQLELREPEVLPGDVLEPRAGCEVVGVDRRPPAVEARLRGVGDGQHLALAHRDRRLYELRLGGRKNEKR